MMTSYNVIYMSCLNNLCLTASLFTVSILLVAAFALMNMATAQSTAKPSTEMNSSLATNTTHPKLAPNASGPSNIVSNTTQQPTISDVRNSGSLSNTPHPKVLSNGSTQLAQNISAPKNTTNSNLLSNTTHPKVS